MDAVVSFTVTVTLLSVLTVLAEYTVPEGPVKQTVSVAMGLVFLSAVTEQLLGLFARMGG